MSQESCNDFKKAVTIFIDILGSQDRHDFSEWYDIMNIFTNTISFEKELDSHHPHTVYKREIHIFSDCAYIIYDFKQDIEESRKDINALFCIACYNTEKVIFEFLRNGFIARGAITYWDIYYDNDKNIWFGPAMNRAFFLESKVARFPRIVIDPEFACDLEKFNNTTYRNTDLKKSLNGEIVKRDEDGNLYLHYLNTYQLGFSNENPQEFPAKSLALCENEINKPRKTIELQKSIEEKYNWLINYISCSCFTS